MLFYMIFLCIPLASFLILLMVQLSRKAVGILASSSVLASFLGFSALLYLDDYGKIALYPWIDLPEMQIHFSLVFDHLSLLMTLIITGVGFLIHVYSNGYMDHEKDYQRFFACMNFFIFSMLLLVLAGDLVLLFIGWEGVGLASYLLIGFWYDRHAAAAAATKAFVMNRIGDFGLLLAILLALFLFHTSDIDEINRQNSVAVVLLTLLMFLGAAGKSAQLPLSTWLPDAMEGPTPVSALIHAATMVTAGVYLVVRFHPLFLLSPLTMTVVGTVGAVTALWAAISATMQEDLKRVLAYSTVSQLGLMFVACGAGAFYAAMFHLTTHAFIKALLFLSAGNVVHMLGMTNMNRMGGLKNAMPGTHWLFLIGVLALSGIPPFAAFFSKDLILEQELISGHLILFLLSFIASVLTAYYLTRAYILTFLGKRREGINEDAPWIMRAPLSVLALLSIFGGFLGLILHFYLSQIPATPAEEELNFGFIITPETGIAIFGALFGVGLAIYYRNRLSVSWSIIRHAFFLDSLYQIGMVAPLKMLANGISRVLEPKVFEGSLTLADRGTREAAFFLSKVQSGQIRSYVAWMALGAGILMGYFLL